MKILYIKNFSVSPSDNHRMERLEFPVRPPNIFEWMNSTPEIKRIIGGIWEPSQAVDKLNGIDPAIGEVINITPTVSPLNAKL